MFDLFNDLDQYAGPRSVLRQTQGGTFLSLCLVMTTIFVCLGVL